MAKSTCGGCKEVFHSLGGFDMHRVGSYGTAIEVGGKTVGYTRHERRCLTEVEMLAKNMVRNKFGAWTTGVEFTAPWIGEETTSVA